MYLSPQHIALLLTLTGLGTSAFFFAQGSTQLVATNLLAVEIPTNTQRSGAPQTPAAPQRRNRSARAILARNIFEPPSDAPPTEEGGEESPTEAPQVIIPGFEPRCPNELNLVGAIVSPAAPEWSYAALVEGQGPARLYRPGMVFASRTLRVVEVKRVVLDASNGTPCQLVMFGEEEPPATPPQVAAAAPAAPAEAAPTEEVAASSDEAGITPAELEQGITRESDTRFTIQRSLLDRALTQQDAIFRSTRLVPHEENGQTVGVRVYGIRRSSLLGRLGIQNGDMLRSMNGFDMTSQEAMLTALGRLRTQNDLSLNVMRRQNPVTIEYSVR